MHLVSFTIVIYYDTRPCERQSMNLNFIYTIVTVIMPDCGTAYVNFSKLSSHIYLL